MANVGDERTRSIWMDEAGPIAAGHLGMVASCDVVIVGGGIAGLSCAHLSSTVGSEAWNSRDLKSRPH